MNSFAAFLRGSQEISISATTSLVYGGPYVNIVSATGAGLRVRLPSALTLRPGRAQRWIANNGANSFTVRDASNNDLLVLAPGDCADFHLVSNATVAGVWKWEARTVGSAAAPGLALLGYLIGGGSSIGSAGTKKTNEWNPQVGTWTIKTDSSLGWLASSSFVIGAHGYIMNPGSNSTPTQLALEQYDPDVHTVKTSLATGDTAGGGCAVQVSGDGFHMRATGGVQKYNEGGNSWSTLTSRPNGQCVTAGGWVSLGSGVASTFAGINQGGSSGTSPANRTDEYTASGDTWAQKATRPGPTASNFGSTILNGNGFTFCGLGPSSGTLIPDSYEYSPGSDAWTKRTDWPYTLATSKTAIPIVNRAYVMGGTFGTGGTQSLTQGEYDPVAFAWVQQADIINNAQKLQNHGMAVAV